MADSCAARQRWRQQQGFGSSSSAVQALLTNGIHMLDVTGVRNSCVCERQWRLYTNFGRQGGMVFEVLLQRAFGVSDPQIAWHFSSC